MTYRTLCALVEGAKIENAAWDAACLISHFEKCPLSAVPLEPERDYPSPALSDAARRRASHEPLQYLLGEWEFYRQRYLVSPDCLIPRSDTEILVEEAIKKLPRGAHFADLCTGSGCIAISILAERPDTTGEALEKYPKTLDIAQKNSILNRVNARFIPALCDVLQHPTFPDACFDAILSNPPYITTEALETLSPEVKKEPRAALDGGTDGLLFYRAILEKWSRCLKKDGFFLFEIGYDQKDALLELGHLHGFTECACRRDLGGNDRVIYLGRRNT